MFNILFVCTGNSCRSQMAEGWLRALSGARFGVDSGGIEMHGQNPLAITVMGEVGVDISGQESTLLTDEQLQWADLVITVCGHADETCPMLPPGALKEHWPLEDPARAEGDDDMIMQRFRDSRNEIRSRVSDLIERLKDKTEEERQP